MKWHWEKLLKHLDWNTSGRFAILSRLVEVVAGLGGIVFPTGRTGPSSPFPLRRWRGFHIRTRQLPETASRGVRPGR